MVALPPVAAAETNTAISAEAFADPDRNVTSLRPSDDMCELLL